MEIIDLLFCLSISAISSYANPVADIATDDTENIEQIQNHLLQAYYAHRRLQRIAQLDSGTSSQVDNNENPCPPGFTKHKSSCYHIVEASGVMTWDLARDYCVMHGSSLVSIETPSEQFYVERLLSKQTTGNGAYWIGATNRNPAQSWRWQSDNRELDFTLWISHWESWAYEITTPSCAIMDTSEHYQWMFWPCSNSFYMIGRDHETRSGVGLICEKELPNVASKNKDRRDRNRRRRHKNRGRGRQRRRDRTRRTGA